MILWSMILIDTHRPRWPRKKTLPSTLEHSPWQHGWRPKQGWRLWRTCWLGGPRSTGAACRQGQPVRGEEKWLVPGTPWDESYSGALCCYPMNQLLNSRDFFKKRQNSKRYGRKRGVTAYYHKKRLTFNSRNVVCRALIPQTRSTESWDMKYPGKKPNRVTPAFLVIL